MKVIQILEHDEILDTGEVVEEFCSSLGHQFRFAFSVTGLSGGEPYIYKKDIETKCETLSTSWTLELKFQQEPGSNIVSCDISAKRTDFADPTLTASIEMSYSYFQYTSHEMQYLYTNEYDPGHEERVSCENILPFPEESEIFLAGGITVGVRLCVKCCDRVQ